MKKRWRVTFTTGGNDPVEIHALEVDAETKADGVRVALEAIRVATVTDGWREINVAELCTRKE